MVRDLPARYAEIAPSAALRPWVACFWSLRGMVQGARVDRVLPDGCADIIIDLAGGHEPYMVGAMRRALVVPFAGPVDMIGIRFRPGGALPFLDIPLWELTDRMAPLESAWGSAAHALADRAASTAPTARLSVLDEALRAGMRPRHIRDDLAARTAAVVQARRGAVGVRELAGALGVGERRLERTFDRCVGLSPKELARVVRFGHAVRLMDARAARWTEIAFSAGYADQAHFIREFRQLAGVTPTQYVAERSRVGIVQYPESGGR